MEETETGGAERRTVVAPGISCGHCVATIEREVGELDGVRTVSADETTRRVTVEWDPERTSWSSIEALLTELNYPPQP